MGSNLEWFYIQQWRKKRWSQLNVPMSKKIALELFNTLNESLSESNSRPLAVVSDGERAKVITDETSKENWKIIACNEKWLIDEKEQPLVQNFIQQVAK